MGPPEVVHFARRMNQHLPLTRFNPEQAHQQHEQAHQQQHRHDHDYQQDPLESLPSHASLPSVPSLPSLPSLPSHASLPSHPESRHVLTRLLSTPTLPSNALLLFLSLLLLIPLLCIPLLAPSSPLSPPAAAAQPAAEGSGAQAWGLKGDDGAQAWGGKGDDGASSGENGELAAADGSEYSTHFLCSESSRGMYEGLASPRPSLTHPKKSGGRGDELIPPPLKVRRDTLMSPRLLSLKG
ncbi:unnamed protein product [Closterium sp. NIES-65]|nr:unnamed protein product [Closterium sp. NIES-65]